ncbi:Vitamin B12 import ATP-binding protein BtuD [Actinomadura sp. RB99]|uniref:dipeptide/oligopeptide/nickel ABC transporter permease/ATP-binding protein n=1 Tax=Actinomadura sp. RB99 TaxID=2691577 RepID=UPI00168460C8|nr:dipeptide/oligopeptide/nickel ABC transporter permease/ATP-binding protein [Actinomadura sp. RB99]MBD2892573.1 Vitamin B12 import ATP-binding protein BtuD [Actinomadura sp. RB99]
MRRLLKRRAAGLRGAVRRPLTALAAGYLVLLALGAVLAPVLTPYDPASTDLDAVLSGPTAAHPLGTDGLGRDVAARLLYGGRISLADAAVAVLTVLAVGAGTGVAAGFLGGLPDRVFTWVTDVMLAVPVLVTLLVVLAVAGDHRIAVMVALGVLMSPGLARLVRGAALTVRNEPYIAAARVSGLPDRHILVRHVLPRVAGPVIVQTSLLSGGALLIDAGLGYLGFGARPPTPAWGSMIAEASSVIGRQPWLLVPPGTVLALAILAFGVLGDTVRDAAAAPAERVPSPPRHRHRTTAAPIVPDAPSTALLSLRDVSVGLPGGHGTTTVVENLTLHVDRGETVGLVGESGCGKSVTARAVLGLVPAGGRITSGTVRFDGLDLAALDPGALRALRGRRIAMISQDPIASLDPLWTAGEQVGELVRRHHGGTRAAVRARALDLLRTAGLPEPERAAARYPHELSGGMAQRVGIAMALAGEPDLLIADEPTTALDVTVQAAILALLRRLQAERGMAILLISHDWDVIAAMCRRAYVMYAGQAVEAGPLPDMLERPRHPYTAGLLGAMPQRARPFERLAAILGTVPDPAHRPAGCRFAPRCRLVTAGCREAPIPVVEAAPGHRTRCVHHEHAGGDGHDRAAAGNP